MSAAGPGAPAVAHLDRVARGGALGLAGAVVAAVAGFALVAVITRGVPTDTAGTFFTVTSLFLIAQGLATLGTDTGLARFLLRHEAAGRGDAVLATLRTAAVPVMVAAVLAGAVLFGFASQLATWTGVGEAGRVPLQLAAVALPVAAVAELGMAASRAFGEMRSTVLADRIVRSGLQLVLVSVVLLAGGGLAWLVAAWAAAYLVAAVLAVRALGRLLRHRRSTHPAADEVATTSVAREFWSFTWLRGVARIAQLGMQKIDIVLVAALMSPTAAAVYTAATRFVPLGQLATQAIQQVLQPRFTAILLTESTATLREVHRIATAWSIALAWPLYLGVAALAGTYLSIFGDEIAGVDGAATVVVVMAVAMMLAVASGPVDTLLLMSGRSYASAGNAVAALVTDIVLCFVLIPRWGIVGAAVAWAAAVLLRCALAYHQVRTGLSVDPCSRAVGIAALLGLLCLGAPLLLAGTWLSGPAVLVPAALVAVAAYLAALHRYRSELALDHLWAALVRREVAA